MSWVSALLDKAIGNSAGNAITKTVNTAVDPIIVAAADASPAVAGLVTGLEAIGGGGGPVVNKTPTTGTTTVTTVETIVNALDPALEAQLVSALETAATKAGLPASALPELATLLEDAINAIDPGSTPAA